MPSDREILKTLGTVGHHFFGRFKSLTAVQRRAIPAIFSGQNVLVASATASGKTEAIVAPLVARLQRIQRQKRLSGVLVLIVAPTRALVNDLFGRLEGPLLHCGWRCGRQTSDHSDKGKTPDVLITTPESFDSMICHDVKRKDGNPCGHLLATVKAVFLDEAHLLENSARGDHVAWLLARLNKLKRAAHRQGWIDSEELQICAGSATVSLKSSLAERLLGLGAEVVRVGGDREIEIYSPGPPTKWIPIRSSEGLAPIQNVLDSMLHSQQSPVEIVWRAVQNASQHGLRKVLIFVPSRRSSDLLSAELKTFLAQRRSIYVAAHHGSLDKSQREEAEKMFALCRDAVLVATSTLEVGIDIGDVDIIVLCEPPPDTSALLQRIGRGGRRSGLVKIVAIPKNSFDCFAFSGMLLCASQGVLEAPPSSRRWGVLVQQIISLIMQSEGKGRRPKDVLDLVEAVWGNSAVATAQSVVDHLIAKEWLIECRGRLFLGDHFSDGVNLNRAYYHCNFESDATTIPVVDHLTHETIAYVSGASERKGMAVAGKAVDVVYSGESILVQSTTGTVSSTFNYDARKLMVSKSYAEHVRRGLGFSENETVIYESETDGPIWFHFGGELYERVLGKLFINESRGKFIRGLAIKGSVGEEDLKDLSSRIGTIRDAVYDLKQSAAHWVGAGRFHKYLPEDVQAEVIASIFDIDGFLVWANTRVFTLAFPGSGVWLKIGSLVCERHPRHEKVDSL